MPWAAAWLAAAPKLTQFCTIALLDSIPKPLIEKKKPQDMQPRHTYRCSPGVFHNQFGDGHGSVAPGAPDHLSTVSFWQWPRGAFQVLSPGHTGRQAPHGPQHPWATWRL